MRSACFSGLSKLTDYKILRRLVVYLASTGELFIYRETQDATRNVDAPSCDRYGLLSVRFLSMDISDQKRDYSEGEKDILGESMGALELIFNSLEDFFWMEGLGVFVLSAYLITFFVLGTNLLLPVIKKKRLRTQIRDENSKLSPSSGLEE